MLRAAVGVCISGERPPRWPGAVSGSVATMLSKPEDSDLARGVDVGRLVLPRRPVGNATLIAVARPRGLQMPFV
jgi:hypothetical protein